MGDGGEMIIKKLENGYLTDSGTIIPLRKYYEDEIARANELTEPTQEELIELGKQQHAFYHKEMQIENAQRTIDAIDIFEEV